MFTSDIKKKVKVGFFFILTLLVTLSMTLFVFAWDYTNLQMGSSIRWQNTSYVNGVRVCNLNVNSDYLNSVWKTGYSSGYQKWNGTKVKAVNSSFNVSNIDYYTPSTADWPSSFNQQGIYAATVLFENGIPEYQYGYNGKVTYAQVATNPYMSSSNSASALATVLGHEIGHVLCLRDVSYTDSYMCAGYLSAPSSGDLQAISNMYK